MKTKLLFGLLIVALLVAGPTLAQDADKPTIAILSFGQTPLNALTRLGILDMLQA